MLAAPALRLAATELPRPGAEVRWVATSELVDPTPYLEGGEVLLTTGLETRGWRAEWRGYVERLAAAGVAALGLGVGLTHDRPPASLARACRGVGLNLFEVPRPTAFVAVSRTAAGLLEAERESAARHALDAQRLLTQAALDVVDASTSVVRRLATIVDGAAALVTRDGAPTDGPHGPRAPDLDLDDVAAEVRRIQPQGLRAAASASGPLGTTVIRPLGVRSRPEDWLAVFVPGRIGDVDRVAITTAVSLLGLGLERRRERRTSDRQLRARALELLVADDDRTARIVLGATAADATTPRLPREVRLLRARGPADAVDDGLALLEDEGLLAAVLDEELVTVGTTRRSSGVADALAARGLRVGVGRSRPLEEASASHETAGHALAATTASVPVRTWDDLADAGIVGLLGRDRASAFARSFLAPLAGDATLTETLGAFLRQHGSRGETAAELGVHRNTVRNRIEQIETLLGRSLDDPQVRVDAWVALQVSATP
nr:PucR family transcriptional regulator [Nocardioides thalensis]